ncbi:MAG: hypothetical protein ACYTHN_03975 [Planctomycetota bacterium]|jgi:hypothetical protein
MTRFSEDRQQNKEVWRTLPGFYYHFPVRSQKPGATILLRHTAPQASNRYGAQPLLAFHFFGPGRTVYMGFDETWRWRSVAEDLFNVFWIQTVRYLAEGRLLGEKKRSLVLVDKDTYIVGETIQIRVRLLGEGYEPVDLPRIAVLIRSGNAWERVVELKKVVGRKGWFEGIFIPPQAGTYDIKPHDFGPASGGKDTLKSVNVTLPAIEFVHSNMDPDALAMFAEKTGGRLVPLEELHTLPDEIPTLREKAVISERPVKLWDHWLTLFVLIALLGFEWAMRKISRMA